MTDRPAGPTPDGLGHLVHVPARVHDRPLEVTTTLTLDTTALTAALARAKKQLATALQPMVDGMRRVVRSLATIATRLQEAANDPVHVAGLCARYQVRAGLDPSYADRHDLDRLVAAILDGDDDEVEGLWLMSPANRRLVAVSAMRGWAEWYVTDRAQVVAHRQWGATRVEVRCG